MHQVVTDPARRDAADSPRSPTIKADGKRINCSFFLLQAAQKQGDEVLKQLGTSMHGLSQAECEGRLATYGPNEIAFEKRAGWPWRLLKTAWNPLVILLAGLAIMSAATGDVRAATVMALMVVLGVSLRFVQESRADLAAAKLKAMITIIEPGHQKSQGRVVNAVA